MAVDTSIFNALGRGVKTVSDWQQEDEQRAAVAQSRELNALNLSNARLSASDNALVRQDQGVIRNALATAKPGATQEDIAGLYEGTRTPTGLTQAQAIRKAIAEQQALAAKTAASTAAAGASSASTTKTNFEVQQAKTQQHLQQLAGVGDVASAHRWLDEAVASGEIPADRAQASKEGLAANPGWLEKWKQAAAAGGMTVVQQRDQEWKAQEAQDRRMSQSGEAANRDLVLDPATGRYVLNQPLQNAKVQRAASGASTTNINTGQKGLDNELKVRGDFRQEPVYKAHQEMQSAYSQIQQSLKQASPAGDLAAATKMMKLLDPGSVVRESELGMAMAATGLLDRIQAFVPNIINGTKLTPDQRKQFQSLADALYGESVGQFNAKRGEYADLGGGYGMNTDRLLGPKATGGKPATSGKQNPTGSSTDLGGGFSLKH